jgi:hypothetical protein
LFFDLDWLLLQEMVYPEASHPLLYLYVCRPQCLYLTSYTSSEDGRHALLHESGRTFSEINQSNHVLLLETLIRRIAVICPSPPLNFVYSKGNKQEGRHWSF